MAKDVIEGLLKFVPEDRLDLIKITKLFEIIYERLE